MGTCRECDENERAGMSEDEADDADGADDDNDEGGKSMIT